MIRGGAFFRLLLFATVTAAVPLQRLAREVRSAPANNSQITEECVSDDVVYHSGDQVPSPGPCEQCFCDPPNVICTMVKCKLNSGCKTIQRANHCCPDYKCDCEYNGKVYNNGERLDRPDDPCQVCYCKGGEVMCTSITCYEREDCKPHYVDGQCCPKYDHCPIESVRFSGNSIRSVNSTSSKREMQPWLLTKEVSVQPSPMSQIETSSKATEQQTEASSSVHKYPQTFKIREILPTTSFIREVVSTKLSTSHKTSSGIPILKLPATTGTHTTERVTEEVSTTHQSIPVVQLSTLSKENALPVTVEDKHSSDLTTESIENLTLQPNINKNTDNIHERIDSDETTENISESKRDEENVQDKSHDNYRTNLDSLKFGSLTEALTDGTMNTKSQLQADSSSQYSTVGSTESEENDRSKQHSSHYSSEHSSEQSSETSSKFSSQQSSAHSSSESNEFNSEESSTMYHPGFDLVVDIHNSPGKTKFTLPTVESFSTMYPNRYDSDSEITESSFPRSSSTEVLTGGVYEDTSSEMSYSSETESASETVVTEQSEQNPNVVSESVPTETTTLDSEEENNSASSTESYRTSTYQTDSPPVSSFSEDIISTRPTLILSQSDESLNPPESISTESKDEKPIKHGHSSESSSSSDSSSSEENEGGEENNARRDELPPILQLNEQIQYLKLGGHHEDDTSGEQMQPLIHVDIFNIHSKAASCNTSSINGKSSGDKNHGIKITEDIKTSGGDIQVSHILLSPNDLKVLAEMLINEQGKHSFSDKNTTPKVKNNVDDKDILSLTSMKDVSEEAVTGTPRHFIVTTELNELNISSTISSENDSSESDESVLNTSDEIKMNHSSLQLQLPEEKESGNDLTTTSATVDDIEEVTQINKHELNTNNAPHNTNSSEASSSEEFSSSDSSEINSSSSEGMTEGSFDVEEVTTKHQRKDGDSTDVNRTEFSNSEDVQSNDSKPEKYRNKKSKDVHSLQDSQSDDNSKSVTENYETNTNDEQELLKEGTTITNVMSPKGMDHNSESYASRGTTVPDSDYSVEQTTSAVEEKQISISKNVLKKNISPP